MGTCINSAGTATAWGSAIPSLPDVIGGHTARRNPQLGVGAAVNLYPELQPPDSELQPTRRVAMLPTHGFSLIGSGFVPGPSACSGLAGSREPDERLLAAYGRTLRVYRAPDAASYGEHVIRPVLGAAQVGASFYVVCDDGRVRRRETASTAVDVEGLDGLTPLGLATRLDGAARRFWMTAAEDRIIRCWRRTAADAWARDGDYDLDPSDTAITCPESLSWGSSYLVAIDAIGGRIYEWAYDAGADGGEKFRLTTRPGVQNTLDLQLLVGDEEDSPNGAPPVVPGGINAANVGFYQVYEANGRLIHTINRQTGVLTASAAGFWAGISGWTRHPGGFVSGAAGAQLYVNGRQSDSDTGGQIYRAFGAPSPLRADLPDALRAARVRTPVVPFGDRGRLAGWLVDRRLHLLDLRTNVLHRNAAGAIDSLTFAGGRFAGADAAGAVLKVSEPDQVVTPAASGLRYGAPDAGATVRPPLIGVGREDNPRGAMRGFFIGARVILGVTGEEDGNLWAWDRSRPDAAPTRINGSTPVYGICAAGGVPATRGQCVILTARAGGTQNMQAVRYTVPPATTAAFAAGGGRTVIGPSLITPSTHNRRLVDDIATDGEFLYVLYGGTQRTGRAVNLNSAAESAPRTFSVDAITEGLTLEGSAPGAIRAVDWVGPGHNVANPREGGRLYVGIQQEAPNPTVVRAFWWSGTAWERDAGRDVTAGISTDLLGLTHDARYLFDLQKDPAPSTADGAPVDRSVLAAFWLANPLKLNRYRWLPDAANPYPARAVASFRGRLVSWSDSEMTIWSPAQGTWPWVAAARRAVGVAGVHTPAVVDDLLFWIGASGGGGLRAWMLGGGGDLNSEPIRQPAIEEILDSAADALAGAVGWADGFGSHSFYVCAIPGAGVSIAYDTGPDNRGAWHVRTSARLAGDTAALDGAWWLDAGQSVQRVTDATTWGLRQVCGGWSANGGEVAFASDVDYRDVDGGPVERVRVFSGLNPERRMIQRPVMRLDVTYGAGSPVQDPEYLLFVSDDGARSFYRTPRRVKFGPRTAGRPPRALFRLGSSRFRVYKVVCRDPVDFQIYGAVVAPPGARASMIP